MCFENVKLESKITPRLCVLSTGRRTVLSDLASEGLFSLDSCFGRTMTINSDLLLLPSLFCIPNHEDYLL